MHDLTKTLERIRHGISRSAYPNETAVRTRIVQPILHALGWDVYDPDQVCAEYSLRLKTSTRRIDMALCVSNRNPRCIVELKSTECVLKRIGQSDGDRQLFEYSFHAGAPLALLTNGVNWRFHSTQSAGTYAERLVSTFDIETDSLDEVAAKLERYLSCANTKSGKAADFAREDLNARLDRHKAREAIPRAWAQLVAGDLDERLAVLLTQATSLLTEGSPARRDVADFLRRLKPDDGRQQRRTSDTPTPGSRKASARPEARVLGLGIAVPTRPESPAPGKGAVRYRLLGEERRARNAKEAYVAIFAALAARDPGFLPRVDPKLRGRKNRGVARTRQELSSNESMASGGASLPGNWWLLAYLSNDRKMRYLRIACDGAGIRFGDRAGLDIGLPNVRRRGDAELHVSAVEK